MVGGDSVVDDLSHMTGFFGDSEIPIDMSATCRDDVGGALHTIGSVKVQAWCMLEGLAHTTSLTAARCVRATARTFSIELKASTMSFAMLAKMF